MQDTASDALVRLDQIQSLLGEHGFEVEDGSNSVDLLVVKDPESGLTIRCVLEDNILFSTIHCLSVDKSHLTQDLLLLLLDSQNGISTSNFQLYDLPDGKVSLTLNNFCKLQQMGEDDHDDILSCLEFLAIDTYAARTLLDGRLG